MHLVRLQPRGRILVQGVSIKRIALRQLPHAIVGRRLRLDGFEIVEQFLIRRINIVRDRRFHALLKIVALGLGQLVDLGGACFE